jgi:hypothetical protein
MIRCKVYTPLTAVHFTCNAQLLFSVAASCKMYILVTVDLKSNHSIGGGGDLRNIEISKIYCMPTRAHRCVVVVYTYMLNSNMFRPVVVILMEVQNRQEIHTCKGKFRSRTAHEDPKGEFGVIIIVL